MTKDGLIREVADCREWLPHGSIGPLLSKDVHVWLASIEIGDELYRVLSRTLTDEEMERAGRFRFEKDRKRFVVVRGILKSLLARYLDTEAGKVLIAYGPYGRPELSDQASPVSLRFNVSHSRGLALFAFALESDIGVDIEFIRPEIGLEGIAERFFSADEKATLYNLTHAEKEKAFFSCWARKEAFLKATGKGLSFGIDRVEVSVRPESRPSLLRIGGSEEEAALWTLIELPAPPRYAAALAVKRRGFSLCLGQWF